MSDQFKTSLKCNELNLQLPDEAEVIGKLVGGESTTAEPASEGPHPITIYFDGSCTPNPGLMSYGVIALDAGRNIFEERTETGLNGHNGIAEALGVRRALELAQALKDHPDCQDRDVRIVGDGQNAIKALNGEWKFKAEPERTIIESAKAIRDNLESGWADKIKQSKVLNVPVEKIPDAENQAHEVAKGKA